MTYESKGFIEALTRYNEWYYSPKRRKVNWERARKLSISKFKLPFADAQWDLKPKAVYAEQLKRNEG